MMFEYDPDKSASNEIKHGLDFETAKALWNDSNLIEVQAKTVNDETRFMVIGKIGEKHWSAICCKAGNRTRIISVRRSRANEVAFYEN